jgi:hypothetical protein
LEVRGELCVEIGLNVDADGGFLEWNGCGGVTGLYRQTEDMKISLSQYFLVTMMMMIRIADV